MRPTSTIGGSDVAPILGLAPEGWRTARDVWRRLIGEAVADEDGPHLEFGRRVERAVLDWYLDDQGVPTRCARRGVVLSGRDVGAPECHGTVDAVIKRRGSTWLVEVKTTAKPWHGVPPHYLTQALHYLALCPAASRVDFAVLDIRARRLIVERVMRHEHATLVQEQLAHVRAWWREHVAPILADPGMPAEYRERYTPPSDGEAPVILPPGSVVAEEQDFDLLARCRDAKREAREAAERAEQLRAAVLARLQDRGASALVDGRGQRLAWAHTVTTRGIDQRRLAAEHPEIVAAYRTTTSSLRLYVAGDRELAE